MNHSRPRFFATPLQLARRFPLRQFLPAGCFSSPLSAPSEEQPPAGRLGTLRAVPRGRTARRRRRRRNAAPSSPSAADESSQRLRGGGPCGRRRRCRCRRRCRRRSAASTASSTAAGACRSPRQSKRGARAGGARGARGGQRRPSRNEAGAVRRRAGAAAPLLGRAARAGLRLRAQALAFFLLL
jgi:hypothetical protein